MTVATLLKHVVIAAARAQSDEKIELELDEEKLLGL